MSRGARRTSGRHGRSVNNQNQRLNLRRIQQKMRQRAQRKSERDRQKMKQAIVEGAINVRQMELEWMAWMHQGYGLTGTAGQPGSFGQGVGATFDQIFAIISPKTYDVYTNAINKNTLVNQFIQLMSFKLVQKQNYSIYTVSDPDPEIGHLVFGTDSSELQSIASEFKLIFTGIQSEYTKNLNRSVIVSNMLVQQWEKQYQEREKRGGPCVERPWNDPKWTPWN